VPVLLSGNSGNAHLAIVSARWILSVEITHEVCHFIYPTGQYVVPRCVEGLERSAEHQHEDLDLTSVRILS
jgi:hypothetical protein